MIAIIGIIVVTVAVLGGYIMEEGHLMVLMQPAEFLIIGGAGLGSLLIGSPPKILKALLSQLTKIMGSTPNKIKYTDLLVMMYELFNVARKDGLVGLESHVERPEESPILTKYEYFIKNHHALNFLSDTMRLIIMGGIPEHDLDAMLDMDLETHHKENLEPSSQLARIGDALPGLGIVAAVLGVVITMGAIGGPPEEIGHKVAAALVGTFLGILLSYGFVQPLATNLQNMNEEEAKYYVCLKQGLLAFHKGFAASIAVEFARRVIPSDVRPSFTEVEEACRASKK
ncbi:MAG TPA: flagellar motor stator protein MotA [candidate division Zixibacteria bacterium]|nr:flagellar motor stator protein MotA [candidate division Zixibacteria bacterium]